METEGRFDFIGNNKDLDDDGDLYLDVDEIASGTDPLDPDDYPGSGFRDQDGDGVSDRTEIIIAQIQKNGIQMEMESAMGGDILVGIHQIIILGKCFLKFQRLTRTTEIGDEYYISLEGNIRIIMTGFWSLLMDKPP